MTGAGASSQEMASFSGAPVRLEWEWLQADWDHITTQVNRLQERIAKATQAGRWGKVQALQRLLSRSHSGKMLAVKRVTENRGKPTPGQTAFCIFFMAASGFASFAPIQILVMDNAKAVDGPNLAWAVNIGLFVLGNAIGAWAGGFVIGQGFGYAAPNWAGALLSVGALVLAVVRADREASRTVFRTARGRLTDTD